MDIQLHGCNGEFEIVLDAKDSKVDIAYNIQLEKEKNTPSNIIFSIYDNNIKKEFSTLRQMFEEINFSGTIKINEKRKKVYKIFWKWPYENYLENGQVDEEKDLKDFEYGISGLDYIFYIKVNAVQSK